MLGRNEKKPAEGEEFLRGLRIFPSTADGRYVRVCDVTGKRGSSETFYKFIYE